MPADDTESPRSPIIRLVRSHELSLRCPLTLERFEADEVIAECPLCRSIHKGLGWREHEGCATRGCAWGPDLRRDHPESVLRVRPPIDTPPSSAIAEGTQIVIRFDQTPAPPSASGLPQPSPRAAPPGVAPPPRPPPPPPPPPPFAGSAALNASVPPPPPPPPHGARSAVRRGDARVAGASDEGRKCPYSMERIATGDDVVECPTCRQVLIAAAWSENGGCTTYGCEGSPDFRKDQR
jgi:hypothetical protein